MIKENINKKQNRQTKLMLIPKTEKYINYMINLIIRLPRTEKFSIGTEYKTSMYKMLENILYVSKMEDKKEIMNLLNKIDSELNCQRIFLRIMKNNGWIDIRKFNIVIEQIYELGKILGGLIKYYASYN